MPRIIIMNQGTEHTRGYDPTRSEPLRKSVARCTWFASGGDVIISPIPLEEGFLRYVGETLGFDPAQVSVLVRDGLRADGLTLSASDLGRLRALVAGANDWAVLPCFWTPDVATFVRDLGIGDPIAIAFAAQRGPELFNRKSHFRQFGAGMSLPLAEGAAVTSARELEGAIRQYLPKTGTVIVKKDNAAGGIGNVTLTAGAVRALPGSRVTRRVEDAGASATAVWEELNEGPGQPLVVEVYHAAAHSFYFEYFIGPDGRPQFLHSGDVRFRDPDDARATELVWVGLDTPTGLPHFSLANALTHSARLAALAAQVGCRGHINIDAIVTTEGELVFNEANVRWGGGSSLHDIGVRLLGPHFADRHALSFVRDIAAPPRPEALRALRAGGLEFRPEAGEGVIVLACSEHEPGAAECLVAGTSRARVRELEASLRRSLA
jgi:Pre ATP-grasp domain/PGM1 C-terminal domain